MSMAHECDRCGELYPAATKGAGHIESFGVCDGSDEYNTWSEIDLCAKCTQLVLNALGEALQNPPT